jgi:hypothetical protein
MVYRDAYRSQLNDRYAGKRDEFHGMVKWAYDKVVQTGLGIVNDPVGRAFPPRVETCAGGLPDGTYYVATAWTNPAGAEGMGSTAVTIDIAGSSFSVNQAAEGMKARGWNIYAGISPQSLTRQNDSTLAPDQTWTQPNTLVSGGRASMGQTPDYLLAVPRMIQRG